MSHRPIDLLIEDMWDALDRIGRYVSGFSHDAFLADEKTIDSVVRNLEIVGESANRLPQEFMSRHSEIEWHKIVGLRHRIVHGYFGIDVEIIWQIVQEDLPALKLKLARIRQS